MIVKATLVTALLMTPQVVTAEPSDLELVQQSIDALVEQFGDGHTQGYRAFRYVVFSKFPKHYQVDAAALFSIEGFGGGNMHFEYLAVFDFVEPDGIVEPDELASQRAKRLRLVAVSTVGGKMWRTLDYESMRIDGEQLVVPGKSWMPGDPGCCASDPISLTFRLDHGQLVEVK